MSLVDEMFAGQIWVLLLTASTRFGVGITEFTWGSSSDLIRGLEGHPV